MKFYYCKHCGKIIMFLNESATPTVCCGEVMSELVPGEVDAAMEKHVPIIKVRKHNAIVTVGEILHPMTNEHYIQWILLQTDRGFYKRCLCPGDDPRAYFCLMPGERVISAYEYCNQHKLWKKDLE